MRSSQSVSEPLSKSGEAASSLEQPPPYHCELSPGSFHSSPCRRGCHPCWQTKVMGLSETEAPGQGK